MSSENLEYYRGRAATERAFAMASERSNVAAIHEELARQYEALIEFEELRSVQVNISPIREPE